MCNSLVTYQERAERIARELLAKDNSKLINTFKFDFFSEMNGDTDIEYPAMLMKIPDSFTDTDITSESNQTRLTNTFYLFDTYTQEEMELDQAAFDAYRVEKWNRLLQIYKKFMLEMFPRNQESNSKPFYLVSNQIEGEFGAHSINDDGVEIRWSVTVWFQNGCEPDI